MLIGMKDQLFNNIFYFKDIKFVKPQYNSCYYLISEEKLFNFAP